MPVRYEIVRWKNLELFLFLLFFFLLSFLFFFFGLSKRFIPHQFNQRSIYCCVINTNELYLLVSSAYSFEWKTINRMTNYSLYTNSDFRRKQYCHCLKHSLLLYSHPIAIYKVRILLQEEPLAFIVSRLGHFNPKRYPSWGKPHKEMTPNSSFFKYQLNDSNNESNSYNKYAYRLKPINQVKVNYHRYGTTEW